MGSAQSLGVNFALEKSIYTAGDTVKGYVELDVKDDNVELPELTVELRGVAFTSLSFTVSSGAGREQRSVRKTARNRRMLVNVKSNVYELEKERLAKGSKLQLPFALFIPEYAVSSMPLITCDDHKAQIHYTIGIYASKSVALWGKSTSVLAKTSVDIVAAPPKSITKSHRQHEHISVTRCCCIPAGSMKLAALSSLTALKPGDALTATYEVDNQTSQELKHISVYVERQITWNARDYQGKLRSFTLESRIAVKKEAGLGPGCEFGMDGKVAARTVALSLKNFSKEFFYCSTETDTIKVRYALVVKAKTASMFVKDPELRLFLSVYRLEGGKSASARAVDDDGEEPVLCKCAVVDYVPVSVVASESLRQLEEARSSGLVTEVEFAATKQQLLKNSGLSSNGALGTPIP
jgi:hypothetical protein